MQWRVAISSHTSSAVSIYIFGHTCMQKLNVLGSFTKSSHILIKCNQMVATCNFELWLT